jgi:hypothetical protein
MDPLLAVAKRLHQIGAIAPSAAAVQRTRLALLRASVPPAQPARPWWPRLATAMPLAIVLIIVGTIGAFASPSALPDSPLYALRNLREAVEIRLAATPVQRASLSLTFAQQRADQLVHVARDKGASATVIESLLRDITSRIRAADTEARGVGADAQAQLQQAESQIQQELTQLHESGTLSPDVNRQLDNTIHDVQSSESTNAAAPTPTPEAPSSPAGIQPEPMTSPDPATPEPTTAATSAPTPATGSSSGETP